MKNLYDIGPSLRKEIKATMYIWSFCLYTIVNTVKEIIDFLHMEIEFRVKWLL